MKIKRRGFIALAMLAVNQAFARKDIFSNNSKSRSQTFKDLFGLHSHFLPLELASLHQSHTDSFRKLGYNNSPGGCLLNASKNYAVSPIRLEIHGELIDEVVLLFCKHENWKYVGVLNQHEADLFLILSNELTKLSNFQSSDILPQRRVIDGLNNSFMCNTSRMIIKINLAENGIVGSLAFEGKGMKRVVFLEKQKNETSILV
ncbi:hypothetical protein [Lacihabitans soyangensis]|uniref:Uncharacterized protein n=1 Tax=Lacihabitans soyangensis TaxID=869394 RepID=A0AAE3H1N9_9BACT|nr:hypothetical protein [Lacihabitans soyangensis]MCP9763288.1 hypothetical protein [Lacihabitans soyangensis]